MTGKKPGIRLRKAALKRQDPQDVQDLFSPFPAASSNVVLPQSGTSSPAPFTVSQGAGDLPPPPTSEEEDYFEDGEDTDFESMLTVDVIERGPQESVQDNGRDSEEELLSEEEPMEIADDDELEALLNNPPLGGANTTQLQDEGRNGKLQGDHEMFIAMGGWDASITLPLCLEKHLDTIRSQLRQEMKALEALINLQMRVENQLGLLDGAIWSRTVMETESGS